MKKLLFPFAFMVAITAFAKQPKQEVCADTICGQTVGICDSIDMPVYIVDGVEVQNIDSISPDDVTNMKIIKDPELTQIFSPRLGGIVLITTKSKKYLKPLLQNYNKQAEESKKNRIPGQILIR